VTGESKVVAFLNGLGGLDTGFWAEFFLIRSQGVACGSGRLPGKGETEET